MELGLDVLELDTDVLGLDMDVLELGPDALGRPKMDPKAKFCFSLVLEGFWGGEATRGRGRAMAAGSGSDPLNSKKTPNTPGARAMDKHQHKGQGKHKHKGMG